MPVLSLSICVFMFISPASANLYICEWWWRWWRLVANLCPTLCDPMDCSLPGSSVHGIFQARILDGGHFLLWGISQPRDWTHASFMGRQILYHRAIREAPIYLWIYLSLYPSIYRQTTELTQVYAPSMAGILWGFQPLHEGLCEVHRDGFWSMCIPGNYFTGNTTSGFWAWLSHAARYNFYI